MHLQVQPVGRLDAEPAGSCSRRVDTLSKVFEYLKNLEAFLDDGDLLEARKVKVEKRENELEMFEALERKSVVVESNKHRVVVFTKAPPHAFSNPFMRFSTPCGVDGQGAWDAKLDMADSHNYMTKKMFDKLGFVRVDYGDYGRKMFVENMEEVGSSNGELVKMGKASRNKGHTVNKLTPPPPPKIEEIPPLQSIAPQPIAPQPIYYLLSQKQKEKVKESLNKKYKELEESKPILEVLENYMTYRKKLDKVIIGRARLSNNEFNEEDKMRIVEHGLPKKMCDPVNFVLPVHVNGMV
ncbi:hypothetical protein Tco_0436420 [Tanacetum coccineum]